MSKVKFYFSDTVTSTKRLWVNYTDEDLYAEKSKLLDRFDVIDALACWGGRDKQDECRDNSVTVSWEIPAEFVPAVKHMLSRVKTEKWKEEDFWKDSGKH